MLGRGGMLPLWGLPPPSAFPPLDLFPMLVSSEAPRSPAVQGTCRQASQQSRSPAWHWVTSPWGSRAPQAGKLLGMEQGETMKPGDGGWHVITLLVLSPPLWPEDLWHSFTPCDKEDTVVPPSCTGAFRRPGALRPHLSLALLRARAAISPSLLLTHCQSLSPAGRFPGAIRPSSDNPVLCLGGTMGMCARPGGQPELAGWVTAPWGILCHSCSDDPSGVASGGPLVEGPACCCVVRLPTSGCAWMSAGGQLPASGLRGPSCPARRGFINPWLYCAR